MNALRVNFYRSRHAYLKWIYNYKIYNFYMGTPDKLYLNITNFMLIKLKNGLTVDYTTKEVLRGLINAKD